MTKNQKIYQDVGMCNTIASIVQLSVKKEIVKGKSKPLRLPESEENNFNLLDLTMLNQTRDTKDMKNPTWKRKENNESQRIRSRRRNRFR